MEAIKKLKQQLDHRHMEKHHYKFALSFLGLKNVDAKLRIKNATFSFSRGDGKEYCASEPVQPTASGDFEWNQRVTLKQVTLFWNDENDCYDEKEWVFKAQTIPESDTEKNPKPKTFAKGVLDLSQMTEPRKYNRKDYDILKLDLTDDRKGTVSLKYKIAVTRVEEDEDEESGSDSGRGKGKKKDSRGKKGRGGSSDEESDEGSDDDDRRKKGAAGKGQASSKGKGGGKGKRRGSSDDDEGESSVDARKVKVDAKGKGKAAAGRGRGGHSTSEEDSDDEHDRKRGKAASPAKGGSKVDAGRKPPAKRTSETSDDDGDDSDDDRGRKGGRGKAREAKRHTFRADSRQPPAKAKTPQKQAKRGSDTSEEDEKKTGACCVVQ